MEDYFVDWLFLNKLLTLIDYQEFTFFKVKGENRVFSHTLFSVNGSRISRENLKNGLALTILKEKKRGWPSF